MIILKIQLTRGTNDWIKFFFNEETKMVNMMTSHDAITLLHQCNATLKDFYRTIELYRTAGWIAEIIAFSQDNISFYTEGHRPVNETETKIIDAEFVSRTNDYIVKSLPRLKVIPIPESPKEVILVPKDG